MKINCDYRTIKAAKRLDHLNPITAAFNAIRSAIERSKEYEYEETPSKADVVFVFGSTTLRKPDTERAIAMLEHRENKKHIFSLDSALFSTYIRRRLNSSETHMFRIGYNDCTGEGDFLNEESERHRYEWFKRTFDFRESHPRCDNTAPVLFALQSEKGWTFNEEIPYIEVARGIIQQIREHTDRRIVLKPHPNQNRGDVEWIAAGYSNIEILRQDRTRRDIIDDFSGVGAVVTHSSSVACESYVEGIPTFALDKRCVVYDSCEHDLKNINSLEKIDWSSREQTLWNWAMTSWHVKELENPQLIDYYFGKVGKL